MAPIEYGELNGAAIGIVMKELVRRAISAIRRQRIIFEAEPKQSATGKKDDVVTSADKAAQAIYLRSLRECFPLFGVVAEEDELTISCRHQTHQFYFTVDPLDGTKAFTRRQSHGVGTMISLVCDGVVIAAYVGDVNTGEIYGYRPDADKVHRISDLDMVEPLLSTSTSPLSEQYVLMRDPLEQHSKFAAHLISTPHRGIPFCKSYEVSGGSSGISMARLWKREVGAVLLKASVQTPWDTSPIVGISLKLGYVFLGLDSVTNRLFRYTEPLVRSEIFSTGELLVVHRTHLNDLEHRQLLPLV